jgi:hypothetical protein
MGKDNQIFKVDDCMTADNDYAIPTYEATSSVGMLSDITAVLNCLSSMIIRSSMCNIRIHICNDRGRSKRPVAASISSSYEQERLLLMRRGSSIPRL